MIKKICKNNKLNNQNIPVIYSCYNLNLIIKLIIEFFKNEKSLKNILGTKRFDFHCEKKYPDISIAEIEDFEYLAFHFILVAKRYYRKILKLKTNDIFGIPDEAQNCINIRYLISLVEINLKSIPKSNFIFHCCSSGNKIVDELFKRYYLRKYLIKIKINKISVIIKPSKDLDFDWKSLSIDKSSFTKPFLKTKKFNTFNNSNKGFIHHKNLKKSQAYFKLTKDLSISNEFVSLDYLSMYIYGNRNKLNLISNVLIFSINIFKNNIFKIIKHNLLSEILEIISCKIYYFCCVNTINSLKLKYIVCSYISFKHENILFQACRDTNVLSIFYDFSMGFPVNKNYPGNSQIDLIKNPNYLITFGSQRCEQYKAVKRLKSENVEIKNALCPQIEFAREQSKNKKNSTNKLDLKKYKSSRLKISIFDSLYGFNYHIKEEDVISCLYSLKISKLEKIVLVHNKRDGFLNQHIQNSNLIYISQEKANFSNSYYSDFIISLGFQGAAIKAAFSFNKPIIFFSENKKFFNDSYFFFNKKKNDKILSIIKKLTFNGEKLIKSISIQSSYNKFNSKISRNSKELFSELSLYNIDSASSVINKIINNK